MAFDVAAARRAGYSDQEIAEFLGKQQKFDTGAALKAGYSPADLVSHLSADKPAAPFSLKDTGIAAAQGFTGALKGVASAFGADNVVAEKLGSVQQSLSEAMSPERKAEQQRRALLERQAAKSGSITQELGAFLGGVKEAPIQSIAQGVSSSIPAIAAGLATAVAGAPAAIAGAVAVGARFLFGAVQGAGEVKGDIMEAVERELRASGMSASEARKQAVAAQEYLGQNAGNILSGAGLGAVASGTGVENVIGRALTKQGAAKAGESLAKRVVVEGGKEAFPEGAQGGQGQYAQNVALTRAGIDTPAFEGVLGSAARDAAVGALTGASLSPIGRARGATTQPGGPSEAEQRLQAKKEQEALARADALAKEQAAQNLRDTTARRFEGTQAALFPPKEVPKPMLPEKDLQGNVLQRAAPETPAPPLEDDRTVALDTQGKPIPKPEFTREEATAKGVAELPLETARKEEDVITERGALTFELESLKGDRTTEARERRAEINDRIAELDIDLARRAEDRGPTLEGKGQGELFGAPPPAPKPAKAVKETAPIEPTAPEGQLDMGIDALKDYAELVQEREMLRALPKEQVTPELQAYMRKLDQDIRDRVLYDLDLAQQKRAKDIEADKNKLREEELAAQSAFSQPAPTPAPTPAPAPVAPAPTPAPAPQVEEQPVPEPTVRQAPTLQTVAPQLDLGLRSLLGIGPTARLFRPDGGIVGKDISDPAQAAEVKATLETYLERPTLSPNIVERINTFLQRPEFQGVESGRPEQPKAPAPPPAAPSVPKQRAKPRGGKPSVAVSGEPAGAEPAEPGAGAAPTTGEPERPVGRGLVPIEQPAGEGADAGKSKPAPLKGRKVSEVAGATEASKPINKAIDEVDDYELDPETKKGTVVQYARKLRRKGLIDDISMNAIEAMSKDRDMEAQDVIDELKFALEDTRAKLAKGEPLTIEGETRVLSEGETKLVDAGLAKLPAPSVAKLEQHYGAKSGSAEFLTKLREDVYTYVTKGAEAVAKSIRSAIKAVSEGVLAVGIIFNPGLTASHFQFNLPATIQAAQEVRAEVPANAKGSMSPEAQKVYEAMAPAAKESGKGFIIGDKPNGKMHAFKADGSLIVSANTLTGKDTGDVLGKSSLEGGPKVTPAGKFTLQVSQTEGYGTTFDLVETFDGTGWISIHSAYLGNPKEKRAERLAAGKPEESRITYGCWNLDNTVIKDKLAPNIADLNGGMMFVIPDNDPKLAKMLTTPGTVTVEVKVPVASGEASTRGMAGREERGAPPEKKVAKAEERRSVQPTIGKVQQDLGSLQTEIANGTGLLAGLLRRLLKSGKVRLEAISPTGDATVGGLYDGNTVVLYASGIPKGNAVAVALHEVGAHLGLKNLLGEKQYKELSQRIIDMATSKTASTERALAQRALRRIPKEDIARGEEVYRDEALAYFAEELVKAEISGELAKAGPLRVMYNRIRAAVQATFNRLFDTNFGVNTFTPDQIGFLIKGAMGVEAFTNTKAGSPTPTEKKLSVAKGQEEPNPEVRFSRTMPQEDIDTINKLSAASPLPPEQEANVIKQGYEGVRKAQKVAGLVPWLRQHLVDKYASVLSKTSQYFSQGVRDSFGNLNNEVLLRQADDHAKVTQDFLHMGGIDIDKDGAVKITKEKESVVGVFKKVIDFGKTNGMDPKQSMAFFSTLLEGNRLYGLEKQGFKVSMTREQMADAKRILDNSPDAKAILDDLNTIRERAIKLMVATGRISQQQADAWNSAKDYVPFNRIFDEDEKAGTPYVIRGKGIAVLRNIPALVGSYGRPVENVLDAFAERMGYMISESLRNQASVKTLEIMRLAGYAESVPSKEASKNPGLVVPRLYKDGKPVFYEVQNPYDLAAFQQIPESTNGVINAMAAVSRVLRLSITAMPPFAAKQVLDDAQRAMFYSGVERPVVVAIKTLYNFPRIFFGELTGRKSPAVREMEAYGIVGDYDSNLVRPTQDMRYELGIDARSTGANIIHFLEKITKASDLAARAAVFEETMRETKGDAQLAQTRARELINFSRRGSSGTMRTLTKVVPFFNAYAQGMDVLYRAASGIDSSSAAERSAARKLFYSRMAIMTGMGFLYAAMMSGDDDYEGTTEEVRDNNWILGNGFKLPVPKEIGFLFKSIPERIMEYLNRYGTDEEQAAGEAFKGILKGAAGAYLGPTAVPSTIKPFFEHLTNYSFFLQRELVPSSMKERPAAYQYTSDTSELAKFVSKNSPVDIAPIVIDNYLRGFFGMAASTTLMMTDAVLNPTRPDRPIYQLPFASIVRYDTIGGREKSEFYDLREKVVKARNAYNNLLTKDPAEAEAFAEKNYALIDAAPEVNRLLTELSNLRKERVLYEQATAEVVGEMSGTERRQLIDEIRKEEKSVLSDIRQLKKFIRDEQK
jgi:hypothetical protein